ncbi:hypothetical protein BC827DRAFT_1133648 [Russula dissimulans]|nr:hypothetical protein BC827DRAFT_1133648 [Russula dissimulans]
MDYDRKSAVSSFYGDRRSSVDALNRDYAAQPATSDQRARRDSSSSFFDPTGAGNLPRGAAQPARVNNAGYNRMSYFDAGREEPVKGGYDEVERPNEGGWDVYADFNNAGPRYSNAFGLGHNEPTYQQLPSPRTAKVDEEAGAKAPVELVTVPALGAEWGKDELKGMTKRGRKEKKSEDRAQKWKAFNRGQYGLCGSKWFTRRTVVFIAFAVCSAIGLVLAFVIPRVPDFAINGSNPLSAATGSFNDSIPTEFSRSPANFSFPAEIALQVDTTSNFLPLVFNRLDAQVYDLDTFRVIATGRMNRTTFPAKKFTNFQMPLIFSYSATNDSDSVWNNTHNACENAGLYTTGVRPGLQFRLNIDMRIAGLPTTHSTATTVTNAACPIELPLDAP